jgi:hypothetical protein
VEIVGRGEENCLPLCEKKTRTHEEREKRERCEIQRKSISSQKLEIDETRRPPPPLLPASRL